ncbi:MAG: PDZ domain-containing protein, partial [Verrucomicrobia bacterium]|nr:PDZ domain-containing protein [Verrucomicrobiota bacterium]
AKVLFVGHDCDLAILEVQEDSFYDGMEPLDFGDLPKVRSTVVTYGYPAGGEQISYTRGVVSRIELQNYVHPGNRSLIGVQTDAAINPGNSGGPVIQDGVVVGVAFQGAMGLENTGFFIPPTVVDHFLKDVEDNVYHGFPYAGIRVVALQNPAHRRSLGLPEVGRGCRIDAIVPKSGADGVLKEDDVVLKVGDYEVASDATILFDDNRLHMTAGLHHAQHGETVPMTVWRQKQELKVEVPMKVSDQEKILSNQYDVLPRYFIYGGLIFTPLSLDYLKTFGRNWTDAASSEVVYELYYRRTERPDVDRPEPIALAGTLSHPVNANIKAQSRALVSKINGRSIKRLEDLIAAFDEVKGDVHWIEFMPNNAAEAISKDKADAANKEILKTYGVSKDRRL